MNKVSPPQVIAFVVSFIGLATVIIIVAVRDLKKKVNQNFLWFSSLVLLYLTVTFITNFLSESQALWSLRLDLMIANYIPATFLAFSISFTEKKYGNKLVNNIIYILLIPLSIIALLPSTVQNVVRGSLGTNIGDTGPLYYLTLFYFIAVLAYAFSILVRNTKNADKVTKLQTAFISYGLGITVAINLVVVFAFPYIGKQWVNIGNLIGAPSIIILVISLVYAVIGQHMFDVRGLILKTLGLFLIIGLTSGAFIALMLFGASKLTTNFNPTSSQYVYFITTATIGGMLFRPAVNYVEKRFSSFFSPTQYLPQTVLNKVSSVVSSTSDLDDIYLGVSEIITRDMNSNRVIEIVKNKGNVVFRSTDVNSYPTEEEFKVLGENNIFLDEISDQQKLAILTKYGINLYFVLKSQQEQLGYLMIGPKNNGVAYDATDIATFSSIASQLSISITNMSYYYQIIEFNKTLEKKIQDATEELRLTNEKLKEADESKDDFISMASHQLSTPIASIEGYLSMANNGYLGEVNPKLSDALKAAAGRTKVMKGIIDDLLNVSHMTSGKFSLAIEPNDITAMIKEEVNQSMQMAEQHQTELNFHTSGKSEVKLLCDGPKVRQVIANFITNAIQYTPKGHVDVYLDEKPNGIQVLVRDDGIGVPENQKDQLFKKFFRAENAKKERPSGNGIGLYVAKKVIEEHGGKIIFQSTQGHGSTFGFFLPSKPSGYTAPNRK